MLTFYYLFQTNEGVAISCFSTEMSILRTHPESDGDGSFFAHSLGRKERYQFLWPLVLAAADKVGKAT